MLDIVKIILCLGLLRLGWGFYGTLLEMLWLGADFFWLVGGGGTIHLITFGGCHPSKEDGNGKGRREPHG